MIADYRTIASSPHVRHTQFSGNIFPLLGHDVRRKHRYGNEKEVRELNLERYRSWLFFQVMIDCDTCSSFLKGAFQRKVKLIVTDEIVQILESLF